jgi:hypothetical protein
MGNDTTTQDTTPDFTDADLSHMAASLDAQGGLGAPATAEITEAPRSRDAAADPDPSHAAGENDAANDVSADADASQTTKAASDGTEPVGKAQDEPDGGSRTKYARERERRDRSWKALQQEKEAFHRERDAFEQERSQLLSRSRQASQAAEHKDELGYTASEYERAAEQFHRDGDERRATIAAQRARQAREKDAHVLGQSRQREFLDGWHGHVRELLDERPELKDETHGLSRAVQALLRDEPLFSHLPDGFRRAVELADLRLQAGSVPSLRAEVEKLKKEIDRLNGDRQPGTSGPTSQPRAKAFDQLSPAEQDSELRRIAAEADSQGVPVIQV